jgi:SHS2 domain-containing protein
MKNKSGFAVIDHTADVGLKFWGNSFSDVLINAARGMFSLIVDRRTIKPKEQKCFKIKGKDYEEVAINWLRELNFVHQNNLFLFKEFDIENVSKNKKRIGVSAIAKGESIDLNRHFIKIDIKLVTYHKFYVKKINDIWEGNVIFDI